MKLKKFKDFYISGNLDNLPDILNIKGKNHYKLMGFVYTPVKQEQLSKEQIIQIGNLRDKYFNSLIDRKFVEEVYQFVYNLIIGNLEEKKALDFGAGSGKFVGFLKSKNFLNKSKFYGLDVNPRYRKNKLYNYYGIINDNSDFPFKNNYFDVIISLWVFQYNIPKKHIEEIYRVLQKNGKFMFNFHPSSSAEHKKSILNSLKDIGFSLDKIIFQSELEFHGKKHTPLEFYVCRKN